MLTFIVQDGITAPPETLVATPRVQTVMAYQSNSMPPLYVQLNRPDGTPLPFVTALAQARIDAAWPLTTWSLAHHQLWLSVRKGEVETPFLVAPLVPFLGLNGVDQPEPTTPPTVPSVSVNPGGLSGRFMRVWAPEELKDPGAYNGELYVTTRRSHDPSFALALAGVSTADDVASLTIEDTTYATPTLPTGITPVGALAALQAALADVVVVDTTTEPATTIQYILALDTATPTRGVLTLQRSQQEELGNGVLAVLHLPVGLTALAGELVDPLDPLSDSVWPFTGGATREQGVQTLGYFNFTVHPSQHVRSIP